jgi:hypothetical protein
MGQGSGQAHRLTGAERLELQRRVRAGETHAVAPSRPWARAPSVRTRPLARATGRAEPTRHGR